MTEQFNEVKNFLKKAVELETLLHRYSNSETYMQGQIENIKHEMGDVHVYSYGDHLKFRHDAKVIAYEPPKKIKEKNLFSHILYGLLNSIFPPALYFVLGIGVGVPLFLSFVYEGMIEGAVFKIMDTVINAITSPIIGKISGEGLFSGIIRFTILTFVISTIIQTLKSKKDEKVVIEDFKKKDKKYKNAVAERNELLIKDREYMSFCTETLENITEMKTRVQDALRELYAKSILFEKYRNFVAVSQMLEYYESNRCYTLTGPSGAYNLFESEVRSNTIILQLQDISDKLEQIKKVQYKIYDAILDTNRLIASIDTELSRIRRDMNFNSTLTINALNDLKSETVRAIAYRY